MYCIESTKAFIISSVIMIVYLLIGYVIGRLDEQWQRYLKDRVK